MSYLLLGFASVCEFSLLWMAAFDMAVLKQFMDASVFCLTYTYLGKFGLALLSMSMHTK